MVHGSLIFKFTINKYRMSQTMAEIISSVRQNSDEDKKEWGHKQNLEFQCVTRHDEDRTWPSGCLWWHNYGAE